MKKVTLALDNEQEYEHVFRLYSQSLTAAMENLMKTCWALATSLLPELVNAALAGHEGIYDFRESGLPAPGGDVLQRDKEHPGDSWLLHYSTASGRNEVYVDFCFKRGHQCIITWMPVSNNPPWNSSAVRDALANGWQHEQSSVLLPDMN